VHKTTGYWRDYILIHNTVNHKNVVITHKSPWVWGKVMLGVAQCGDGHQERTDAGEQSVGLFEVDGVNRRITGAITCAKG
jgi:hypothetical protein